jgi:hypothetical protein
MLRVAGLQAIGKTGGSNGVVNAALFLPQKLSEAINLEHT